MQLIICEKPSVGMTISSALGIETKKDGYMESEDFLVSWCIGHLAELSQPSCYGSEVPSAAARLLAAATSSAGV